MKEICGDMWGKFTIYLEYDTYHTIYFDMYFFSYILRNFWSNEIIKQRRIGK